MSHLFIRTVCKVLVGMVASFIILQEGLCQGFESVSFIKFR
jgi:hypothetical protein